MLLISHLLPGQIYYIQLFFSRQRTVWRVGDVRRTTVDRLDSAPSLILSLVFHYASLLGSKVHIFVNMQKGVIIISFICTFSGRTEGKFNSPKKYHFGTARGSQTVFCGVKRVSAGLRQLFSFSHNNT